MYVVTVTWNYHGPGNAVYGPYKTEEEARADIPAIEVQHTNQGVLPIDEIDQEFDVDLLQEPPNHQDALREARRQSDDLHAELEGIQEPWAAAQREEALRRIHKLEQLVT